MKHERGRNGSLTVRKIKERIAHECAVAGCEEPIAKQVIHGHPTCFVTIYGWCLYHDPSPHTGYALPYPSMEY